METREPIGGLMSAWGAALAVLLWSLAGAMYLALATAAHPCAGVPVSQPCGPRYSGLREAVLLVLTLGGALLATLGAALGTIVAAGRNRDWLAVGGLLVVTALSLVALSSLTHSTIGTFVDYLYGFSPENISTRPVAYGASIAHLVLPAPVALAYHLLHERARRASGLVSLAGLVAAVGLLVAFRLAPAVPLPT
jgi:hypothetical protein